MQLGGLQDFLKVVSNALERAEAKGLDVPQRPPILMNTARQFIGDRRVVHGSEIITYFSARFFYI
jgi:hypothetical protein